jgi:threonine dehydratase
MHYALQRGNPITLEQIDTFVDGASVKKVGEKTFKICQNTIDRMLLVNEGKVCTTILQVYNEQAIVLEPAGALTLSALDSIKDEIKGKKVVCILSGSNNDITRMEEIKERSLLHEGLKKYFTIKFPQRPGALKEFLSSTISNEDDIVYFQYKKSTNSDVGQAVIGIEIKDEKSKYNLEQRMMTAPFESNSIQGFPNFHENALF